MGVQKALENSLVESHDHDVNNEAVPITKFFSRKGKVSRRKNNKSGAKKVSVAAQSDSCGSKNDANLVQVETMCKTTRNLTDSSPKTSTQKDMKSSHFPLPELDVASALCDKHRTRKNRRKIFSPVSEQEKTKSPIIQTEKISDFSSNETEKSLSQPPRRLVKIPKSLFTTKVLKTNLSRHFDDRRKMIMDHRASHERLRNIILENIKKIVPQTENGGNRSSRVPVNDNLRPKLETVLQDYEVIMVDLIRRQQMEATALAAMQTLENGGVRAPEVQVCFPFPDVFDHARRMYQQTAGEKSGHSVKEGTCTK